MSGVYPDTVHTREEHRLDACARRLYMEGFGIGEISQILKVPAREFRSYIDKPSKTERKTPRAPSAQFNIHEHMAGFVDEHGQPVSELEPGMEVTELLSDSLVSISEGSVFSASSYTCADTLEVSPVPHTTAITSDSVMDSYPDSLSTESTVSGANSLITEYASDAETDRSTCSWGSDLAPTAASNVSCKSGMVDTSMQTAPTSAGHVECDLLAPVRQTGRLLLRIVNMLTF
ncbi:hypothetical protein J8273_7820 [Carpediemonas membranifera]|uniref:Uncharacterized protein n=1 Tax=Carpediemonas membranifera TaxID=201153 RepID=A0A8J6AYN4_9EUKA|nr:hypothetical protein J8273_7820 [Carpediemonas membranifera]|eukprot:KAG9390469.1 hypothetical protein J8273_7820 [Carpediemonas membranifera]